MHEGSFSAVLISFYNAESVPASTECLTSDQYFSNYISVASYIFAFVFFENILKWYNVKAYSLLHLSSECLHIY